MPTYWIVTKNGIKDPKIVLEECKKLIEAGIEIQNNMFKKNKSIINKALGGFGQISYSARFSWPYPNCLECVFSLYSMMQPKNAEFDKTFKSLLKDDCELYRKVS